MNLSLRGYAAAIALGSFLLAFGTEGAGEERAGVGISLETPRFAYSAGEPIALTLRVYNYTRQNILFEFRDGQRSDFAIRDGQGNEVWRWSRGRLFPQVLGRETIGPERPELVYRAEFNGELRPGIYSIRGELTSANRSFSAEISVVIR